MSDFLNIEVEPVDQPETALKGADIAMCATNTEDPVFFKHWMEPGMHVSSIKKPEMDMDAIRHADRVAIHTRDTHPMMELSTELPESAQLYEGKRTPKSTDVDITKFPTLPELITGKAEGRKSDEETTLFMNNLGLGYQFAAVGSVVVRKAKEQGVGHELPTDWFTEDVHP
jgi:ornithine cyclodeaminase/alanine dehydrogenase-like protein (mu-crystallin family)